MILLVALICIFPMTNVVGVFFMCLLAIWTSSFVKCLFTPFAHFWFASFLVTNLTITNSPLSPLTVP